MARASLAAVRSRLAEIGRRCHSRGWALGTSGNFSAVVSRRPLRLAITASALPKGRLRPADILECDDRGEVIGRGNGRGRPARRPSAETLVHLEIARLRGAGAILHTHSAWTTVLSDLHAADGGVSLEGYEMLKGLAGVNTHEHREWVPILPNDQDMSRLAGVVRTTLERFPEAHALLLYRHGLYTWGETLDDAERHVEILEFLFETLGRTMATNQTSALTQRRGTQHPARSS